MQYKRLFKYDPQCWMPSVEGHVICGHTDFVTSFLYFDTKSWTLIAYCALMLSIVNLRIKVDVTISCLLFYMKGDSNAELKKRINNILYQVTVCDNQ